MDPYENTEALTIIQNKLSQLSGAQIQPSIYRVHKPLRNINPKAYEPQIIAIGPYHRGKDDLRMMEEHKVRYLESLLRNNEINVESCISVVAKMEQAARDCYAEPINLASAQFVGMLVLDGCFIIELIRKSRKIDATCMDDPLLQTDWMMNGLQRDLLLFENQIPFFVLDKLFELIEEGRERLIYLVLRFWDRCHLGGEYKTREIMNFMSINHLSINHLLDLIHQIYRPSFAGDVYLDVDDPLSADDDRELYKDADNVNAELMREGLFILSATELTHANVKFKQKYGTLFDVDFQQGIMLMPTLIIEERTECFLRNLIAFEQHIPNHGTFFTDHSLLFKCLINSSRDVEILSQCGIIRNFLGESEVVVNILNGLAEPIAPTNRTYAALFHRVNAHHKRRWNRWCAIINRKYFDNPWAFPSFLVAFTVFLLTVGQTVCSILQVV